MTAVPTEARRGGGIGTGVTGGWEPPEAGVENQTEVLQKSGKHS